LAQGLLRKEEKMEVGDKITFPFGKGEKEGIVYKIFPQTVYIKVDFPNHKGKIIKRSLAALSPKEATKEQAKKLKGEEKKKKKAAKEERKKEKAAKKSTA
jgi:hypothetical protein